MTDKELPSDLHDPLTAMFAGNDKVFQYDYEREPPRTGIELVENAATLGDNNFGKNFVSKVIDENIELVVIMGETDSGKTTLAKQIRKGLRRKRYDAEIFTQDQAIALVKQQLRTEYPEEIHYIINDTALWGYHIPKAWDLVSNKMTKWAFYKPVKKKRGKLKQKKILEITAVGNQENKGRSTLKSIVDHYSSHYIILGIVADTEMKKLTLPLRTDEIQMIPDEKVVSTLRSRFGIVMEDLPIAENEAEIGQLLKKMYARKAREHRVAAYAKEMAEHRERNRHKFRSLSEIQQLIPSRILERRTVQLTSEDYLDRIRQMDHILRIEYGGNGFTFLNPLRRGERTEYYEPDALPLS